MSKQRKTKTNQIKKAAVALPKVGKKKKETKVRKPRPGPSLAGMAAYDINGGGASVADYLHSLAYPRDAASLGVRSPVSYNVVPSDRTTTARTTSEFTVSVGVDDTTQVFFYPGHGQPYDVTDMDEQSFHGQRVNIAGTIYLPGPIDSASHAAVAGWYRTGLTLGEYSIASNAASVNIPIFYDETLPYRSSEGDGVHSRWQLVSAEYICVNETPVLAKGGSIVSSVPNQNLNGGFALTGSQGHFNLFPDTNNWGCERARVCFKPQKTDQALWHCNGNDATNNRRLAGAYFFLNGCANVQTYRFLCVYNWELAGVTLSTVSKTKIMTPKAEDIVSPVTSIAVNTRGALSDGRLEHLGSAIAHYLPIDKALHAGKDAAIDFSTNQIMKALGLATA